MKKIFIYTLVSFFTLIVFLPFAAHASTLYFDSQEKVVGTSTPFTIALNIDSDVSINTISVALNIPENLIPKTITTGNSIINLWIDSPVFDQSTRILLFSGSIPGGYVGKGGRLLEISFSAITDGPSIINFSPQTLVLKNDSHATQDSVTAIPLNLTINPSKENLDVTLPDTVPPEPFAPLIARDPLIQSGAWMLVFGTTDKDSGINHYEVQEIDSATYQDNNWHVVVSPFVLYDQSLSKTIFVKAVDENGNSIIERVAPTFAKTQYPEIPIWIILIGICCILFFSYYVRHRRSK